MVKRFKDEDIVNLRDRLPREIANDTMELLWWLIAIVLMAVGLLGTVLPLIPGAIIILAAAILHQVMLPGQKSRMVEHRRADSPDAVVLRPGVRERIFRRETIRRDEMGNLRRGGWDNCGLVLSLPGAPDRAGGWRDRR